MNDFEIKSIKDVCDNVSRSFDFSKYEKVVFVNTGDVLEGKFLHQNLVDQDNLPGQAKKAIEKNDILFSEIRPINKRFTFVNEDSDNFVVSTKFMVIKSKKCVLPKYLYHFLKNGQNIKKFQLEAEARSGTFPQITFESIEYFPIGVPLLKIQEKIVSFLDDIEDKIDKNHKSIQNLERVSNELYNSLFSDFLPTIEKKQQNNINFNSKILDLFPNELIDIENKQIPKGWEFKKLSNFCSENKKKINPSLFNNEDFEVYDIGSFDSENFPSVLNANKLKSQKSLISENMILISKLNPETPRIWCPLSKSKHRKISSTEFISLIPKDNYKYFLLCYLKSSRINKKLASMVTGTSKSHQRVRRDDIFDLKIISPPKKLLEFFNSEIEPIHQSIELKLKEIQILKKLNYMILPKIMTGEFKIKD